MYNTKEYILRTFNLLREEPRRAASSVQGRYVYSSSFEPQLGIKLEVRHVDNTIGGLTLSGLAFAFEFRSTRDLESYLYEYTDARPKYEWAPIFFQELLDEYRSDVLFEVRIDAEPIDNNGIKSWIVENIQSNFMRRIGSRITKGNILDLAQELSSVTHSLVSNQKAHNAIDLIYRLFKDWPHWAMDFVEETARQNNIDSIIFTNSIIQKRRWMDMNEDTARRYYEKLPESRGYSRVDVNLFQKEYKGVWEKGVKLVDIE